MIEEPILMKKKKYTNKIVTGIFSICLVVMLIGLSYAFFIYNKTGLYTHTINGGKMGVSYNEITGNNITIDNAYPRTDKEALTYGLEFEFTITGYNESERNVYYAIEMDHGADVAGKDRFLDSDMKLSLYENDEVVFENEIFNNLDNQDIHYGHISYGTSQESPVVNTYKLRIWINDNVMITNTPDTVDTTGKNVYSSEEFANHYANFKVNVIADLTYDDVGYLTYDANGGSYTPKKTSLTTGLVTTQKPVMEGKGFLGWSGTKDGEVEFKSGDVYTGDYDVLYAVYSNTRNVMGQIPDVLKKIPMTGNTESTLAVDTYAGVTEIYFINDTQENIDARYNAATYKADLTYNNQGSVKGWLEAGDMGQIMVFDMASDLQETIEARTYKLYIAAEDTIYFNDGRALFSHFLNTQTIDLTYIDTSMVTDMTAMFGTTGMFATSADELATGMMFLGNLDLNSFNTSQVTSMNSMFGYLMSLTELDVSNFDTSNVTDMFYMFYGCSSLTSLDLSNWDTSNVTNMSNMFTYSSITSLDVSNWDTSNVTNMSNMFTYSSITSLDVSNWDTGNVTNMSNMFAYSSITSLNVSNWDTSNVTHMNNMFSSCSSLTTLDASNWIISNVSDMYSMFSGCSSLTTLDVSNWIISNVSDMSSMFSGCSNLTTLDVSSWDISNVTNMSSMFSGCSNLTTLDVSSWDISNVTNMSSMFFGCSGLTSLDLSSWDTSNVTNMSRIFYECSSLTSLDLSSWDTSNVTNMSRIFYECSSLTSLDLSSWDTSNVADMSYMFWYCSSLTTIYANSDWKRDTITSSIHMFSNCTKLVGAIPYKDDGAGNNVTYANPDTGYFTKKTA